MTVKPRGWQPAMTGCNHTIWIGDEEGNCVECEAVLIWVVPDTRLQAIADAWNAEYDPDDGISVLRAMLRLMWPVLATLLDALTKENNEPMCTYCGWSGQDIAKHQLVCKHLSDALTEEEK